MTQDISSQYTLLSEREHVLKRSGIYVGSISSTDRPMWIIGEDGLASYETIHYNPGLLKLFDEIIMNSVDEHVRSGSVKNIWVFVDSETGRITVADDGGIPVVKHTETGLLVPELIFGQLRAGSNFNDDDRSTAGMNGMGSVLVNIFSKHFTVYTCDNKKYFTQEYENNMEVIHPPLVKKVTKETTKGTAISFLPDYEKLETTLDENIEAIKRRVYDIAGTAPNISVYFNNEKVPIGSFEDYVRLFTDEYIIDNKSNGWTVVIGKTKTGAFNQISFVNRIDTFQGGTHVNNVSDKICKAIATHIKTKFKVDVKPSFILQHLMLFVMCDLNSPNFTSQTKEHMCLPVKDYSCTYTPDPKFLTTLFKSPIIADILLSAEMEHDRLAKLELKKLNKQTGAQNAAKKIVKFEDASSKNRAECTLLLCEGDSAAKSIASARNPLIHGYYPLKGKPINVTAIAPNKMAANQEFNDIRTILGLKFGERVEFVDAPVGSKLYQLAIGDAILVITENHEVEVDGEWLRASDLFAKYPFKEVKGKAVTKGEAVRLAKVPNLRFGSIAFAADADCVIEGTKVVTSKNIKNIEEVNVGDEVLTHKNRFMPVTNVIETEKDESLTFVTSGGNITVSVNHKMLIIREGTTIMTEASNVRDTDKLISANKMLSEDLSEGELFSIEEINVGNGGKFYDITVEEDSTFVALSTSDNWILMKNCDGVHICGLLCNIFYRYWPELFEHGVIKMMNVPVIICDHKDGFDEFFDVPSYNDWAKKFKKKFEYHYFKGLGTYDTKVFKRFLDQPEKYMITISSKDDSKQWLSLAFDPARADDRKEWLAKSGEY